MRQDCEVRIVSPDFQLSGVARPYSVILDRQHYGAGSFEIHIAEKQARPFLARSSFIIINGDPHRSGIIRDYKYTAATGNAPDEWSITGDTLAGLLKQRLTVPPADALYGWDRFQGKAENAIKYFIGGNLTEPVLPQRKMAFVSLNPAVGRGMDVAWRTRYESLSDVIKGICEYADIGLRAWLDFSTGAVRMDADTGTDRSTRQSDRSPVIFDPQFGNIQTAVYTDSISGYSTTGYAGGAGEDEDRLFYILGNDTAGIDRFEAYLDCSGAEDALELQRLGDIALAEKKRVQSVEATVLPYRTFVFERDYRLGDMVTIRPVRGAQLHTRITGVKETWQSDGYVCEPLFGGGETTLKDIIKAAGKRPVV